MKSLFWLIVALILSAFLIPVGFMWSLIRNKKRSKYLMNIAESIDQSVNVIACEMFNDLFRQKNGYNFGNKDETISSGLGKNYRMNKLTKTGTMLNNILHKIDPYHSINSIEENP